MKKKSGITITNMREVEKMFKKLDTSDKKVKADIRRALRKPFNKIRTKSRSNLKASGSIATGNLLRSLRVATSYKKVKATFFVGFGSKLKKQAGRFNFKKSIRGGKRSAIRGAMNHFHFINSGTSNRKTKSGSNRGRVKGNAFADKAIRSEIPKMEVGFVRDFNRVFNNALNRNKI